MNTQTKQPKFDADTLARAMLLVKSGEEAQDLGKPVKGLIRGVINRGDGVTVVMGTEGAGKSSIMARIAADASTGSDTIIGELEEPGKPLRVLIIADDGGSGRMAATLGHYAPRWENIILVDTKSTDIEPPKIGTPLLECVIDYTKPDLVILDSLSTGNIEKRTDVYPAMQSLNKICQVYNLGMIVTHHRNREGSEAGSAAIMQASRDYYAFGYVPDTDECQVYLTHEKSNCWKLNKTKIYNRLELKDGDESYIDFYLNDTNAFSTFRDRDFRVEAKKIAVAREKEETGYVDQRTTKENLQQASAKSWIMKALENNPDGITNNELIQAGLRSGASRSTVEVVKAQMVKDGELVTQKAKDDARKMLYILSKTA